MKVKNRVLFFFIGILLLISLHTIIFSAGSEYIAKVKLLKGKVSYKLKSDKKFKTLKSGQKLKVNTIISTASKSFLTLKMLNGSLIELKANSQIVLNKNFLNKSSVSLIQGRARFKIEKLIRKEDFNVYTPTAVVGVRGTEYDIGIANDGSMAVNVEDGKVAVDNGSSEANLTKDQGTEVSLESKDISTSKKHIDIEERYKQIDDEIKKKPAGKIDTINDNLDNTIDDQEKALKGLSGVDKNTKEQAGSLVDSALFNQCKSRGLYAAATKIKDKNRDNKEVQESYKKSITAHERLDRLDKLIDEKFAKLEKIFEEKGKMLDEKFEKIEDKFNKKLKGFD